MSIQCLIFDADGVTIHPWRFRQHLEDNHDITPAMTRDFFTGTFAECIVGNTRLRDALPPYLSAWKWPGSVEEFVDLWLEVEDAPNEPLLAAIGDLKREGYLCCLATNQEVNRAEFIANQMGFDEIFDELFFSCHIGFQKPQPEFYETIESALLVGGSQILFWDDSEKNVLAAREIGWNAKVYTGFDDFEARMRLG